MRPSFIGAACLKNPPATRSLSPRNPQRSGRSLTVSGRSEIILFRDTARSVSRYTSVQHADLLNGDGEGEARQPRPFSALLIDGVRSRSRAPMQYLEDVISRTRSAQLRSGVPRFPVGTGPRWTSLGPFSSRPSLFPGLTAAFHEEPWRSGNPSPGTPPTTPIPMVGPC
jgi:hypothetical protein